MATKKGRKASETSSRVLRRRDSVQRRKQAAIWLLQGICCRATGDVIARPDLCMEMAVMGLKVQPSFDAGRPKEGAFEPRCPGKTRKLAHLEKVGVVPGCTPRPCLAGRYVRWSVPRGTQAGKTRYTVTSAPPSVASPIVEERRNRGVAQSGPARLPWEQDVGGSNPSAPTTGKTPVLRIKKGTLVRSLVSNPPATYSHWIAGIGTMDRWTGHLAIDPDYSGL